MKLFLSSGIIWDICHVTEPRCVVYDCRYTPSCEVMAGCSNICGFHGRDRSTSKSWDVIFWKKQRIGTWKWTYGSPNERKPIENILYLLRFLSKVHAIFGIPSSPNLSLHESTVPPFERTTPPNEQKLNQMSDQNDGSERSGIWIISPPTSPVLHFSILGLFFIKTEFTKLAFLFLGGQWIFLSFSELK